MVNVLRWSALGVGMCTALVLVSGCKDSGGIGGIGAPATAAAGGTSQGGSGGGGASGGFQCQPSTVSTCLMPMPDNATKPSGKWAKDGAMSKADYIDWYSSDDAEKARENSTLDQAGFVSAGYTHWQNSHGTQAEVALTSFASTAGAMRWIDYDNNTYAEDYTKLTSLVPGTYTFQISTANDDGTWTTVAVGRFGKVVMEVYVFANSKTDVVAQNNLASWAATQAGILKRAASSS